MKSNQQVEPTIAEDFSSVSFAVRGLDTLTLNMGLIAPSLIQRAACVGFAQVRIVDAAAVSRTDKNGQIRSADEMLALKWEKMAALIAHYETGTTEWSRVATGGARGGYLFEALVQMYAGKQTPEQVREFLDGLTDKEQAALREDDTVAPVIAAIKKARAGAGPKVDTAGLLAGLA